MRVCIEGFGFGVFKDLRGVLSNNNSRVMLPVPHFQNGKDSVKCSSVVKKQV